MILSELSLVKSKDGQKVRKTRKFTKLESHETEESESQAFSKFDSKKTPDAAYNQYNNF